MSSCFSGENAQLDFLQQMMQNLTHGESALAVLMRFVDKACRKA
jgi:hypothetical protein